MEFSVSSKRIIYDTIEYAENEGYEFITPEMILLLLLTNSTILLSFNECGISDSLLISDLTDYISNNVEKTFAKHPPFSAGADLLLQNAVATAINSGNKQVLPRHLLYSFWSLTDSYAVYFIEKQGVNKVDLFRAIAEREEFQESLSIDIDSAGNDEKSKLPDDAAGTSDKRSKGSDSDWKSCAPCLNDTLTDENPLIGRTAELDRTIQILCRKDKNNPLHIGEPGVGKTAITYGLVRLIREGNVPAPLKDAKVFALDLGSLLAGTQFRGEFEKRFKQVLSNISKEKSPIIYIDEIHNIAGAGAVGEGSFDASNMLKPYLSDGHIRFIGATTFEEYKKHFEKNKSMVRRFQNVEVKEPSTDETVRILEGLKGRYESFHGITYEDGVLEYAAEMSRKYINDRFLPDKAIDLIDEAGAYRKLHPVKPMTVDRDVINQVLTTICRVPVESVVTDDAGGLAGLEERLKGRIFGQDEAVSQVVNAVKFSKAGLQEDNKPLASLLFVGPTGVGKTEIARSLAEELGVKLIRFDMSEYGEKHTVAKLIGSPAGYVGYEDGGLLTEAVRKSPSAVLLLDEIEKAHSDIYNVLLQVMDYATLTDNQGRKADFRNIIVIMTSNAGASRIGKSTIGFHSSSLNQGVIMEAVKQTFQPEFRNRLNKIVVFNGMDEPMAERIVDKKLKELGSMLAEKGIVFTADESARSLIKKKGISQEFGAREADRVIRNEVKPLFVDEMLFGKLKNGGTLALTAKGEEFAITAGSKVGEYASIQA